MILKNKDKKKVKAIAREHGMAERQEQEQINNQRLLSVYAMLPQRQKLAKRGIKKNRMAFDSTAFEGTAFEGTAFETDLFRIMHRKLAPKRYGVIY